MKRDLVKRSHKNKMGYKCKHCDKKFGSNTNVEKHIERVHDYQSLKCNTCDSTFLTGWRLKKHGDTHIQNAVIKKCHYFNSNKPCPFEKLECKFNHKLSSSCTSRMCQFKHQ